ncbi:MAG TPA: NAD(P)-dependent oxidoreductase, partial [Solirubrobacterales bacterium]
TARELAEKLSAAGISYLDAPVSGGVAGARAGSLGLFLAVEENLFERVEPMLNAFAGNVISVGTQPGQGQLAKLLNNVLSATAMAATAEVLVIGVRAGLEAKVLLEAFNAGTGRNSATTSKFPDQILPRTFETGFRLELMIKDLSLALEEGHAQGTPMILAAAVSQVWAAAGASVGGEADFSEIARLFENWAGVELNDAGRPAHDTSKD